MKKNLLLYGLILVISLTLVGCKEIEESNITMEELNEINDQISEYFISNEMNYHNLSAHYVDEENNVVVVELIANTSDEQKWFRENIVNSDLIKFIQGGPYTTSDNNSV